MALTQAAISQLQMQFPVDKGRLERLQVLDLPGGRQGALYLPTPAGESL